MIGVYIVDDKRQNYENKTWGANCIKLTLIRFNHRVCPKCFFKTPHLFLNTLYNDLKIFVVGLKKNISGGERTVIVLYSSRLACRYAVTWLIIAPYTTKLSICLSISAFWDTSYFKMLFFEALLTIHISWGFFAFWWVFSAIFYLLICINNEPLVKSVI